MAHGTGGSWANKINNTYDGLHCVCKLTIGLKDRVKTAYLGLITCSLQKSQYFEKSLHLLSVLSRICPKVLPKNKQPQKNLTYKQSWAVSEESLDSLAATGMTSAFLSTTNCFFAIPFSINSTLCTLIYSIMAPSRWRKECSTYFFLSTSILSRSSSIGFGTISAYFFYLNFQTTWRDEIFALYFSGQKRTLATSVLIKDASSPSTFGKKKIRERDRACIIVFFSSCTL